MNPPESNTPDNVFFIAKIKSLQYRHSHFDPRRQRRTGRIAVFLSCVLGMILGLSALAQGESTTLSIHQVLLGTDGRLQFQMPSTTDFYYVLYRRRDLQGASERVVSMQFGEEQTITLTEPLGAGGVGGFYRVSEHRRDQPGDIDGDGIDDVQELRSPIQFSPVNPAVAIDFNDGTVSIPDRETYKGLSYQGLDVLIDTHLESLEFVKFYIFKADTDNPEIYFMNTTTHRSHRSFSTAIGVNGSGGIPGGGRPGGGRPGAGGGGIVTPGEMRGEIVYHPFLAT